MLSLSQGRPFAKIVGGKMNGKIIHIDTGDNKCCGGCSDKCTSRKKCCGGCKMCCSSKGAGLIKRNEIGNEFTIEDEGKMMHIPNIDTREVPFIAGPSGSGKSTYAANYIKMFKKIFPKNDIFVFSRLAEDPVIDALDPTRIIIDESLIENPIDATSELSEGSLVLFDDIDTVQDKKLKDAISKLKNDILEIGRHSNIYCVNTSHLINSNDKKDARTMMNECHSLTVFPKSGSAYQIKYALKNYFGLSPQQIQEILDLPSRWVTLFKSYPQCVLHEKGCYIT